MFIYSNVQSAIQYVTEAFFEIFGSSHDDYPVVGIQPFTGKISHNRRSRTKERSLNWNKLNVNFLRALYNK